jgi:hypothetical protein
MIKLTPGRVILRCLSRAIQGLIPSAARGEQSRWQKNDAVVPKGQEILYKTFHFAAAVKGKDHLYCSGVIGIGLDGSPGSLRRGLSTR